ncbi:MAG TPA: nucleotidyltransferase family protein [Kiloniellaceae bacterium]|nr:nucleotidyltransferase family protein [Kiloniellaceae bacterium]
MAQDADGRALIRRLLGADGERLRMLRAVRTLRLPQAAIGAGFVRAAVWDHLHGFATPTPLDDIDVVYFDPDDPAATRDADLEAALRRSLPGPNWDVKNQARMHLRNGDAPYRDLGDAIAHWLETATCVAARLNEAEDLEIVAPWGLDDLMNLRIRATPSGQRKGEDFRRRLGEKDWQGRWPRLTLDPA